MRTVVASDTDTLAIVARTDRMEAIRATVAIEVAVVADMATIGVVGEAMVSTGVAVVAMGTIVRLVVVAMEATTSNANAISTNRGRRHLPVDEVAKTGNSTSLASRRRHRHRRKHSSHITHR